MENNKELEMLKADFDFDRKRAKAIRYIEEDIERLEASMETWKARGHGDLKIKDELHSDDRRNIRNMAWTVYLLGIFTRKEQEEYDEKIERVYYGEGYEDEMRARAETDERLQKEYEESKARMGGK